MKFWSFIPIRNTVWWFCYSIFMKYSGSLEGQKKNVWSLSLIWAVKTVWYLPLKQGTKGWGRKRTRNYDQVPFFGMTNKRCSVTQRFNGLHRFNASMDFVPSSVSVVSFTLPRRRDSVACPLLQYPDRLLEVKVGISPFFMQQSFFKKTSGTHQIRWIL